jgi:hypothetical protein
MLQKLQIVQINDKDLKDAMLLFLAAQVSDTDMDAINAKYIAKLFSEDWGFYHTATTNLIKIKEAMAGVKVLTADHKKIITEKVDYFLKVIEDTSKSSKWKSRSKTGTKKPWYKEVSDWV